MITKNPYEACSELFAAYPLAVRAVNHTGSVRSMVLMTVEHGKPRFHILNHDSDDGHYSLRPWRSSGSVDIESDGSVPAGADITPVTGGVPLPRHGSLLGWKPGKDITALIVLYTEYEPEHPVPNWMLMPLAGLPESQWPPFADKRLFGPWFWDHYRAGRIVSLASLIADSRDTVFWVVPESATAGSVAVRATVSGKVGTLRRGAYVYQGELRARRPVPSLDELLADSGKTDLAPRFRRMAEVSR
jgi:hypothetical protein